MSATITLGDLSKPWPAGVAPYLDQPNAIVDDMSPIEQAWRRDGFVILPAFMPDQLIDAYAEAWEDDNGSRGFNALDTTPADRRQIDPGRPMGWPYNTPYMHVPAAREICCHGPLASVLQRVIGEPAGVHLNLTGWRSTQRNWHQDGYLNPDSNADWYAAVWIALDDISPDAGPFEYIPGSHRHPALPTVRHDAMRAALTPDERDSPNWPTHSERILTPLFEDVIEREHLQPQRFIARRGDVLVWHSRLLHRGTVPNDPTLERRALIAHYSGIHHRPDFPTARMHLRTGREYVMSAHGYFFPIDEGGHQ